jgi:hypothetical protein
VALASVNALGWHAAMILMGAIASGAFAACAFASVSSMPKSERETAGRRAWLKPCAISPDVDRLVVDVCRAKGIGGIEVSAPKNGWPPTIVVRLHGFSELESFSAASRAGKLECALSRPERRAPTQT